MSDQKNLKGGSTVWGKALVLAAALGLAALAREPAPVEDHPTDIQQLFDAVAHRRAVPAPPTDQTVVRSWRWLLYGPLLYGDWIYVDDHCRALLCVLRKARACRCGSRGLIPASARRAGTFLRFHGGRPR